MSDISQRKRINKERRKLGRLQCYIASKRLASNSKFIQRIKHCSKILSYLPVQGEISPYFIYQDSNAKVYLPKISDFVNNQMQYYSSELPRKLNRFRISEPLPMEQPTPMNAFDIVLMPLVGFDRNGHRLGMGGGFYDRALEFTQSVNQFNRPLLIGVAHHFQECETITRHSWDIPLDIVLTDRECIVI